MKRLFFLSGLLAFFYSTRGQELISVPSFPQDTGTVSIIVNCNLGNQGLLSAGGTGVYAYMGLITSASTGPSNWLHVPAACQWGTPNAAVAATYLGNNQYSITIPNIRAYFGVPAGEVIYKVAILFWGQNGNIAQRNADGSDMFVPVYSTSLAGRFELPPFQPTYTPIPQALSESVGNILPIKFITNKSAALTLSVNGSTVATAASADSIGFSLTVAAGTEQVIATANDGVNSVADTLSFFAGGAVNIAPLPAGAKEGINYLPGDTAALLVVYAPHKHKIVVVGDFNSWTQQTAYQMNETPDSNYFWLRINGLDSGTEYAYQYVIDDTLQLADYNTEKVLDKNVDPGIPASTYPNLKTFPAGAAGTLASVIQTGQTPYTWQVSNFQRPAKTNLRIYELWIADFIAAGNWQTLTDTLNYLKNLGINAVEIEPFCNFEGANSWGYNPNFYFAPDKVYGPAVAVKQFIDAAHAAGMAVIMDLVMNHSFGSSPMVQMYWNNALGVPAANNPWFNQYPTHAYNVGYQFNHESAATIEFTRRVIKYWLTSYHLDGFRWDLAKGFTQTNTCDATGNNCNVGAWGNYDAGRVATWDTIYNQMQAASPGSYCILEMFADNSEQQVEANYGMMLWGEDLSGNYNQATMGYSNVSPGGASWDLTGSVYSSLGGWNNPGLVVYQESHDDERLMYNNETHGNSSSFTNVKDTTTGLSRNMMSTAFWALAPGPKMLTEFGEVGFDYSVNWCSNGTVDPSGNCRLTPKPIRWDYLQVPARRKLHDVYASLLHLRANYPALATGATSYSLTGGTKYLGVQTDSLNVMVVGNFDVLAGAASITFPSAGTWYDYLQPGDSIQATGAAQTVTLSPGEYHVFTNKNFNATDTGRHDTTTTPPPPSASLSVQIRPNPVISSSTNVVINLPADASVSLVVYSISGKRLGVVDLGNRSAGQYTLPASQLPVDPIGMPSGYYVIEMITSIGTAHLPFLVLHR
ncbi:MAG TPA: alpha-amylase family glycosyl hydrolase [Puia sp.]|nr:alpha-amylase family glycosyl hydrolase [Puia sp.]